MGLFDIFKKKKSNLTDADRQEFLKYKKQQERKKSMSARQEELEKEKAKIRGEGKLTWKKFGEKNKKLAGGIGKGLNSIMDAIYGPVNKSKKKRSGLTTPGSRIVIGPRNNIGDFNPGIIVGPPGTKNKRRKR